MPVWLCEDASSNSSDQRPQDPIKKPLNAVKTGVQPLKTPQRCVSAYCLSPFAEEWIRTNKFWRWMVWYILDADSRTLCDRLSMSSTKLPSILSATEEDIQLLLAAQCHLGTQNCDKQMEPYVWKRRPDGDLSRTCIVGRLLTDFLSVQASTSSTLERRGRSLSLLHGLLPPSRTPTTFV